MVSEHFTRDLRVPRFVGAHQSKVREPEEEQESAETGEQ